MKEFWKQFFAVLLGTLTSTTIVVFVVSLIVVYYIDTLLYW